MRFEKDQIPLIARALVKYAQDTKTTGAFAILLSGDLGAGKTALSQGIAKELGVADAVLSPTFVIMRSYTTAHPTFKNFVHIDAYRIKEKEELPPLKLEDVFSKPSSLVCVEWPEKLFDEIPQDAFNLLLSHEEGDTRNIEAPEPLHWYLQKEGLVV